MNYVLTMPKKSLASSWKYTKVRQNRKDIKDRDVRNCVKFLK